MFKRTEKAGIMHGIDSAVVRDLALLVSALASLVRALWPHGIRKR
jgi:hypothetical protein